METDINNKTCCQFKKNSKINPITGAPLSTDEQAEWTKKCMDFMSTLESEKIENMKNTDIFATSNSDLLNITKGEIYIPRVEPKKMKPSFAVKPKVTVMKIPAKEFTTKTYTEPILPPSELPGPSVVLPKKTTEIKISQIEPIVPKPYTEIPMVVTKITSADDYFRSINSELLFNKDVLEILRLVDLKDILKEKLKTPNSPNIIENYRKFRNITDTYTKIASKKDTSIDYIIFMKKIEYKEYIPSDMNDYIYNIIIGKKLNTKNIQTVIDEYRTRGKKSVQKSQLTIVEKPNKIEEYQSEKIPFSYIDPREYGKLTKEQLDMFKMYNLQNIKRNYASVYTRAKALNSDAFLSLENIDEFNSDLYDPKYKDIDMVYIIRLFLTDQKKIPKRPSNMPQSAYDLYYINNFKNVYNNEYVNYLTENEITKIDLTSFKEIMKIFYRMIMSEPFDRFIPMNLNLYILDIQQTRGVEPPEEEYSYVPPKVKSRVVLVAPPVKPGKPEIIVAPLAPPKTVVAPVIDVITTSDETYLSNKKLKVEELMKKWNPILTQMNSNDKTLFENFKKLKNINKYFSHLNKSEYLDYLVYLKLIK